MTAVDVVPRCWAIRTDRTERETLIAPELARGVLRQGWGYLPTQDLRQLRERLEAGRELDGDQRAAWQRNWRLLPDEPGGVSAGDLLVLPNLPDDGRWTIAQAGAAYRFEIAATGDHGHTREVTVLREDLDPHALAISAGLRRTTRCQRSMWNIDDYANEVAGLVRDAGVARPSTRSALTDVLRRAEEAAWLGFSEHFGGAELEQPIAMLLRGIYDDVEERGGPGEDGADLICRGRDPVGLPLCVAVQIKMWDGIASDTAPLQQLARAAASIPDLTAAVVVTTAEATSTSYDLAEAELETELGIPVRTLVRANVTRLLLRSDGTTLE